MASDVWEYLALMPSHKIFSVKIFLLLYAKPYIISTYSTTLRLRLVCVIPRDKKKRSAKDFADRQVKKDKKMTCDYIVSDDKGNYIHTLRIKQIWLR